MNNSMNMKMKTNLFMYKYKKILIIAGIIFIVLSIVFLSRKKKTFSKEWSACNKFCGGGKRYKYCTESSYLFPEKIDCNPLEESCNTHECPIDGKLSEWSEWSTCPACSTEDTHKRSRNRTYTPPLFNGNNPDGYTILEQEDICTNLVPCPITIVPSMFTIKGQTPAIITSTSDNKEFKLTNKLNEPLYKLTKEHFTGLDTQEIIAYYTNDAVTANNDNHILYEFNTIKKGDYSISIKHKSPDTNSNSWFIKIDKGEWLIWHLQKNDEKWLWDKYPENFDLSKGKHTIHLAPRDKGSAINILKIEHSS